MSRHLTNLQRVVSKFQARYGEDDAVVQQLKQELAAQQASQPAGALPVPERRRTAGRITQRSNDNSLAVLAPRAWRMAQGSGGTPEPRH